MIKRFLEIKGFNAFIDSKPFFVQAMKSKQEDDYKMMMSTKWWLYNRKILLHYSYHQNKYKNIFIDLSRQTNTSIPQQINFTEKLEQDDGAIMFFIAEKREKNYFKL